MNPEELLYAALSGDGALTSLVGTNIFIDAISQNTPRPTVAFQRDSTEPVNTITGQTVGEFVNFSIVVHSDSRADAEAIAAAIKTPLYAADFWQTDQAAGYEPELDANSLQLTYRYFIEH